MKQMTDKDILISDLNDISEILINNGYGGWYATIRKAVDLLKEQESKTGHWIDTTNTIGFPRCECSECNSEAGAIWMKYCPNCGAKMEGR